MSGRAWADTIGRGLIAGVGAEWICWDVMHSLPLTIPGVLLATALYMRRRAATWTRCEQAQYSHLCRIKQRSPCRWCAGVARGGQNDHVAERVRLREIEDDEGRRLLRIIRRGTGSVVTWRRARMVQLSAQGMPAAKSS
ncbi:hypothetical protein GCM10010211_71520 [Streptomyces albospinus]|uniref:Uncharacterized protein n=1 Tax=Streptomyces albospinus TaxID=285515 RepID=A0ABQ2VMN4_9ACTN|nr:hypothetical protein GCM10010211_71520 [Streptomyces albospinus]